jgi:phage protein D
VSASDTTMLPGVEVKLDGQPLDPGVSGYLLEARADLHMRLPDRCSLRFADPQLTLIDRASFPLGAKLEMLFTAPGGTAAVKLFAGLVASLEPEFDHQEATLVVRGYDRSHMLNHTRRTSAYQAMSYSSIARRLAGNGGLTTGTIDDSGAAATFVQQSNETDWEFLWRLADEIGFEVHVSDQQLNFRKAGSGPTAEPVRLAWGEQLVAFRPRVTAVQQAESVTVRGWDPATKEPIEATAEPAPTGAAIGIERAEAVSALGGGTVTVADQPIRTAAEATAVARSVAARLGEAFVEAEGTALGDPRLVGGAKVSIEEVGSRFGGTYTLSSATHVLRAGRGYETRFTVSGRAARSMLDLVATRAQRSWRHSVVVALVTNNEDPDALGRVRVRYPVLGTEHEGWWARLTAPAAGAKRGLLMMPQVGDEVLVAFEHDDEDHPYVIGSVWNGTAKPQELVHVDGSFALRSDKQVLVEAAEAMTLTGDKDFTVTAAGNAKVTTSERSGDGPPGDVTVDAKGNATMKSGQSAKIDAGADAALAGATDVKVTAGTKLTLQGGTQVAISGAMVEIQASGVVKISGASIMLG